MTSDRSWWSNCKGPSASVESETCLAAGVARSLHSTLAGGLGNCIVSSVERCAPEQTLRRLFIAPLYPPCRGVGGGNLARLSHSLDGPLKNWRMGFAAPPPH